MLVKVADFGLSRSKMGEADMSTNMSCSPMMTGMAGTFHWMAPEVLMSSQYTHKADIYSFGIVLWEIVTR